MAGRGPRPESGVTAPIPDSMHPDVRALLENEQQLQAELNGIQEDLRKKRDERESLLDNPKSETAQQLQSLEDAIEELRDQQAELRTQMTLLTADKSRNADKMRSVNDKLAILRLEVHPMRDRMRRSEEQIKRLRHEQQTILKDADRVKGRMTIVSVPELEKKLKELDDRIAVAKKDAQKISVLEVYQQEKNRLERTSSQLREYWVMQEKAVDVKQQIEKLQQSIVTTEQDLKTKELEIQSLEKQREEIDKKKKEDPKPQRKEEQTAKLVQQLNEIQKTIREKIEEKKRIRSGVTGSESDVPLSDGITHDIRRRDELRRLIAENRSKIPATTLEFDRELSSDLIGPRRCNLQSLQDDFGVIVTVQPDEGRLIIKGHQDDLDRAVEAIKQALQRAKENRVQATLSFNGGLARDIIGKGGANIDRIQTHSGAKIFVNSKEGKIEIQGNAAAVDEAKKMINEFLDNTTLAEYPFRREMLDVVYGKGGRTIRHIQNTAGLKNLSVDQAGLKIIMVGGPEAIQAAKAAYDGLLEGFNPNGVEVKFEAGLIGALVGKGGANIHKIEEETGTFLDVQKPGAGKLGPQAALASVRIKGSRKGVEAARRLVEELLAVNAREEVVLEYDRALLSFLIARPAGNPDGLCVLEDVRRSTGCATIQAVRDTNKLRIVGKTENAAAAKEKLQEILAEQAKGSFSVEYPRAAFAYLNRKQGGATPLDAIRKETGSGQIRCDKASGRITVVGEPEQAEAAAAAIRHLLDGLKDHIRTIPLASDNLIGRVIGPGGGTIRQLEERTRCDITIDKENVAVQVFGDPAALDAAEAAVKDKLL